AGATSALSGLTVTGNDIAVANIGGAAAGVTGATTLTATTAGADTGEISLNGALNVNTLALTAAASITQTNALTATSLTATLTGATSALTLSNSGNQITTLNAVTTPGGFTLNNGNNNVTVAGNITATNNAVAIDAGTGSYTQNNNIDVTAGSGPITVTADTVTIGTTNAGGNALATSGVLTIKAKTAARAMSLAGASGFDIAANEILAFATGATGPIVIGDTSSTGVMTIGGAIGLAGKTLTLNAGSITDTGTQTISATNVTLNANGQIGTSSANGIDIAATNLNVKTTGNASAFVRTGAINLGVGTSGSNLGTGTLDLTATGAVTQTATTGNVTAGTLQVKTLANAGAAITLTNSGNNVSAVNLQSRNLADGLNAAGAIQYTDTNGFDVAAVATTGNATLSAGGTVTQSGAISASGLALTGTGGNQTLRHASNAVTTLAANTGSIDYSQAGALTVGTVGGVVGVTTAVAAKIETTGAASDLTLTNAVTSNGTGDAIVLKAGSSNSAGTSTGGKLVNSAGASGIVASAGRYLVYSGDPGTTTEGVTGGYSKRYNTSASFTPGGSANMFLYRIAPTLTISSNNASKMYGQVNPVFTGNSSGYIDGDTAASVGVTRTSAAVFNTPVAQSGIAITSGATNNENYTLVLSHGALEIKRASISSVSGITANNKVVDGNTSATLNTGAAGYAGLVAGDVLSVATANGNFDTPFVGGNKTVFVTGITLGGAAADNYDLLDKTATTRASITDLSGVPGALIFAPPPTPVFRARTAGLSVADANALLESTPTASGGCGASGAAEGCLSVSALREATDQAPGLVSVTVAGNGAGFQFSLPSGVLAGAADSTVPVEVATLGGRPLPDWLRFDADKQVFVASTPPPGALPLQIRVSRGERSAIVTITEAQAGTPASRGVVVQRQTDSPARTPG
uniref:beta strand repeat-containing protein n=1 Tax=Polaromonas sp. TaxID=1869339 RepID=UPI003752F7A3